MGTSPQEPRGLTQASSPSAQGQCPRQCLHPLSSACVLGPLPREPHPALYPHLAPSNTPNLALLGTPAQGRGPPAWGTLGLLGALMPLCLTLGCSWSGGSHRLHRGSLALLPVGVGAQLGWAPCVGVWGGMGTPGPGGPGVRVWVGWMPWILMPLVRGWGAPGCWCDPCLLAAGAWPSMCTRRR